MASVHKSSTPPEQGRVGIEPAYLQRHSETRTRLQQHLLRYPNPRSPYIPRTSKSSSRATDPSPCAVPRMRGLARLRSQHRRRTAKFRIISAKLDAISKSMSQPSLLFSIFQILTIHRIIESILNSESVYQGHANMELRRHIKRRRAGE